MGDIPKDFIGCNVRITDRFNKDYKLTKAEKLTAFFFGFIFICAAVSKVACEWFIVATN